MTAGPELARPTCVAGENACPPEDVGGPGGYADFLEVISDATHPEHPSTLAWAGGSFDLRAFDQAAADRRLAQLRLR